MTAAAELELLEQEFALVDVDALEHHPQNPRKGDLEVIGASMDGNGFYGACLVQRSTGYVLVGNHRLKVARAKGASVVPVLWLDVDDDHAMRILLSENAANDAATNDQSVLAAILKTMSEDARSASGYSPELAAEILAIATVPAQLTDVDDAPAKPAKKRTRTKDGDVWLLGPHRLVAGDATVIEDVRAALADRAAAMLFTDPPYGVDFKGGGRAEAEGSEREVIIGDDLSANQLRTELLEPAFRNAEEVLAPGGAFYVCAPPGAMETQFRLALDLAGLPLRSGICWVKHHFVMGRSDYHGQHETMLYGWRLGGEPLVPPHFDDEHGTILYGWSTGGAHTWEGGRKQTSVWTYDKPAASKLHPTMKPVALVQRAIENNTRPGALVLDLFGGSGTTLIACHAAGRVASLVELDRQYVDVICRRWQEHTGVVPILERTGKPVDFLKAA